MNKSPSALVRSGAPPLTLETRPMPEQFTPVTQPEFIDVSRPAVPKLPELAWIRITLKGPQFGVSYRSPTAPPEEPLRELMHGEEHVVDLVFARRLVEQKRAVLILGKQEYDKWPRELLPMTPREQADALAALQAR
jgi:hypothetical protein